MRDFDIPVLRSFLLIASGKNFIEAASLMGRSPSAITQQIKRLEDDLGAKVFRRTSHHVVLTPDGERLIHHAQRLLRLHDEALMAFVDAPGRRFRLGLTQDLADWFMPSLLAAFNQRYRDVSLEFRVDRTDNLIVMGRRQQLDLVIAERRDDASNQGEVFSLPMVWLGAPNFTLPESDRIPVAMLEEPCPFRSTALAALSSSSWFGDVLYSSPSLQGIFGYCKWGEAVTVRTSLALHHTGLTDVGERLGLPQLPLAWYCSYSSNPDFKKINEDLIEMVKTQLLGAMRPQAIARRLVGEAVAA
ncbi:LysR substrate-binding domain-containing protein [Robbsia sp. KACC 23696]|uniref:LysR substrate-binding domain-containing protein n=1 Tax=Robbsia sp. KACC 23696 TaxID=3149231 RepID=UPI00325B98E4